MTRRERIAAELSADIRRRLAASGMATKAAGAAPLADALDAVAWELAGREVAVRKLEKALRRNQKRLAALLEGFQAREDDSAAALVKLAGQRRGGRMESYDPADWEMQCRERFAAQQAATMMVRQANGHGLGVPVSQPQQAPGWHPESGR